MLQLCFISVTLKFQKNNQYSNEINSKHLQEQEQHLIRFIALIFNIAEELHNFICKYFYYNFPLQDETFA